MERQWDAWEQTGAGRSERAVRDGGVLFVDEAGSRGSPDGEDFGPGVLGVPLPPFADRPARTPAGARPEAIKTPAASPFAAAAAAAAAEGRASAGTGTAAGGGGGAEQKALSAPDVLQVDVLQVTAGAAANNTAGDSKQGSAAGACHSLLRLPQEVC